jgi:OOP family OmpA-OmpF porin
MKLTPSLLAATFISIILTLTSAQAEPFYLGVNAGASRLKEFCTNTAAGFECKDTTLAYGLDGGYQFGEMFGMELGYGLYGTPQTKGTLFGSAFDVTQQLTAAKLAATLTVPLSTSFAFTGKLGVVRINSTLTSTSASGTPIPSYSTFNASPLYGVGIKYSLNETWAMRMQYDYIAKVGDETTGTDSLSLLTAGLTYSFGKTRARTDSTRPAAQKPRVQTQAPLQFSVFLHQPPPGNKQALTAAIAKACLCQPIFVRMNGATSVIYQIELAPGLIFSDFKYNLLGQNDALGIKGLMQYQDQARQ